MLGKAFCISPTSAAAFPLQGSWRELVLVITFSSLPWITPHCFQHCLFFKFDSTCITLGLWHCLNGRLGIKCLHMWNRMSNCLKLFFHCPFILSQCFDTFVSCHFGNYFFRNTRGKHTGGWSGPETVVGVFYRESSQLWNLRHHASQRIDTYWWCNFKPRLARVRSIGGGIGGARGAMAPLLFRAATPTFALCQLNKNSTTSQYCLFLQAFWVKSLLLNSLLLSFSVTVLPVIHNCSFKFAMIQARVYR